jgi:hypothetical protein
VLGPKSSDQLGEVVAGPAAHKQPWTAGRKDPREALKHSRPLQLRVCVFPGLRLRENFGQGVPPGALLCATGVCFRLGGVRSHEKELLIFKRFNIRYFAELRCSMQALICVLLTRPKTHSRDKNRRIDFDPLRGATCVLPIGPQKLTGCPFVQYPAAA